MARCLYLVTRTALWNLIVPRTAVAAGPMRPLGGHQSWAPKPCR